MYVVEERLGRVAADEDSVLQMLEDADEGLYEGEDLREDDLELLGAGWAVPRRRR